jgi:hypothetical protein
MRHTKWPADGGAEYSCDRLTVRIGMHLPSYSLSWNTPSLLALLIILIQGLSLLIKENTSPRLFEEDRKGGNLDPAHNYLDPESPSLVGKKSRGQRAESHAKC